MRQETRGGKFTHECRYLLLVECAKKASLNIDVSFH